MNYFLEKEDHQVINRMAELVTQKYYNDNNTLIAGKLLPIGVNKVLIKSVGGGLSVNNNPYITVTFLRDREYIKGYKTKITFTPQVHYFFNYEEMRSFCEAVAHELKPKPDDMDQKEYMRHVYKRFKTFIGRSIDITISHKFELSKDSYGDVKQKILYYDVMRDIVYRRAEIVSFDDKPDWDMLYNTFRESEYVVKHK